MVTKKPFIWQFRICGFELIGIYANITDTLDPDTVIIAGLTLFDGMSWALNRDKRRYYLNSLFTLKWL